MLKKDKPKVVDELANLIKDAPGIYLTDFSGLNVSEMQILRKRLREKGITFRVVRNRLLQRASEMVNKSELVEKLVGPTAICLNYDDPYVIPKVLMEFINEFKKLKIKAAWVEGELLDEDQVQALAKLPSRDELLAKAVNTVAAPISQLMGVLQNLLQTLVATLDAIKSKQGA